MWAWLPEDVVSRVVAAAPAAALPTIVALDQQAHRFGRARLDKLAELVKPPFSLAGSKVLGLSDEAARVNLTYYRIGDDGVITFAAALREGALPHLFSLCLQGNNLSAAGLSALAAASAEAGALAKLGFLSLSRNVIDDTAIASLPRGAFPSLRTLFLPCNRIRDADLGALAMACPRLETVSFTFNKLSDAAVEALANAAVEHGALPRLKVLHLGGNRGIGDRGMYALAAAIRRGAWLRLERLSLPSAHGAAFDALRNAVEAAGARLW